MENKICYGCLKALTKEEVIKGIEVQIELEEADGYVDFPHCQGEANEFYTADDHNEIVKRFGNTDRNWEGTIVLCENCILDNMQFE